MFCSTIIPTIDRPTLTQAVQSVLDQTFDSSDFEVIVVNDSGRPLTRAEWQDSSRVRLLHTNQRERSVARNAGAAIARGKHLHFLDDDDLLMPSALQAFWNLDQKSQDVIWLHGGYQTVDNEGELVEAFRPGIDGHAFALFVAGESIPFQASLLHTDWFHSVGGFESDPKIIGVEDRDLGRRMAFGGEIASMDSIVAQIRIGESGSTTNWQTIAESDRLGRERALNIQNAFSSLWASTDSSYLRGRVTRACLASTIWNLKRKKGLTAVSRAMMALAFMCWNPLTLSFWWGLRERAR